MTPGLDYVETDDVEEALTFIEKLKRWWDAALWLKRVFVTLKILFYGAASTVVVGQAVDENFIKEAAIGIGVVDPAPIDTTKGMLNEQLMDQLADLQQQFNDLKDHQHNYPDPLVLTGEPGATGAKGEPGPPGPKGDTGATGPAGDTALTPASKAAIIDLVEDLLPPDHRKLH